MGVEPKICPSCKERNNPAFTQCWKCSASLMKTDDLSQQEEVQLMPIPRVKSRAPQKNTIEWEIPGEVLAGLMNTKMLGFMAFAKVKVEKKDWWSRAWESFSARETDAGQAIFKIMPFLERHGYTIAPDSVQYGEKIGDPEYFKKLESEGFANEKEEGPVKQYFPNGQIKTEGVCRNGKLEGLVTEYYENRQIKTEEVYKNGELDGPFKSYYKNGKSKSDAVYRDGKLEGLVKRYYENGQLEFEAVFKNGEPVAGMVKKYDENGSAKS